MRNYKFRLYPNKVVEASLDRQLDCADGLIIGFSKNSIKQEVWESN